MPLDLMTLSLISQPVSMEEGVRILERDHYRCQYCGLDGLASFDNALAMSVDFVVPRARKGKKDPQNLVACCRACNMIKGRKVYSGFDEAKAYVLLAREELRKTWDARVKAAADKVDTSAAAAKTRAARA
jgi:5-methylcytosine-specific restriction endonuclease McrA